MSVRNRLAGHTLRAEGAPYDERGRWIDCPRRSGPGRGKCSCGELSDVLPSTAARQRWHREHKAALTPPP